MLRSFSRTKTKEPKEKNTSRQIREKRISLCFGVGFAVDFKNIGLLFRLKRAETLSDRKGSNNQSWQIDEKEHGNQISAKKKSSWQVVWYISLTFSMRSLTVMSLFYSLMGFFNLSDFDFWDQTNVGRSEKIRNAK